MVPGPVRLIPSTQRDPRPESAFRTGSERSGNHAEVLRYVASGVLCTLALTGCGGSMSTDVPSTAPATTAPPPASATTTAPPTAAAVPSPLTGEAQSAATGDIPDNPL